MTAQVADTIMDANAGHDHHLELQDLMSHPQAFMSEMMGDTISPISVVQEGNGHVDNHN